MNTLLKNQLKKLKESCPSVTEDDIEKIKILLKDFHMEKKQYHIVGIYVKNLTYVALNINYTELCYYIWYNNKYRKDRKLFLEDLGLLDYGLSDREQYEALVARATIEKNNGIDLNNIVNSTIEK